MQKLRFSHGDKKSPKILFHNGPDTNYYEIYFLHQEKDQEEECEKYLLNTNTDEMQA